LREAQLLAGHIGLTRTAAQPGCRRQQTNLTAEPAAHRRQRRERQIAKGVLAVRAARNWLGAHHGGGMAGRDRSKADWFCKSCKTADGSAYKNFGTRTSCRVCGLTKGACFGRVAGSQAPSISVGPTYAERQVRLQQQEELRKKTARVAELEARLKKQESGAPAARKEAGGGDEPDADMLEEPVREFEYTVEQLQEQRRLLRSQGRTDSHADVKRLSEQVRVQQQAKVAALPAPARADRAEKEVKRCKALVEGSDKKAASLRDELAEVQRKIAEHDERARLVREELEQAEAHRDALYESLRSAQARARAAEAGPPEQSQAGPGPGALDGALAASALLPDEVLAPLGHTRDELAALLRGLAEAFGGWQEKRAREAAEAAAKIAAETAAAVAATEAAAAASAAATRAEPEGAGGGGARAAGGGSGPQAGGEMDGRGAADRPVDPVRPAAEGGGLSVDEAMAALDGAEFGEVPQDTKRALVDRLIGENAKRVRTAPY